MNGKMERVMTAPFFFSVPVSSPPPLFVFFQKLPFRQRRDWRRDNNDSSQRHQILSFKQLRIKYLTNSTCYRITMLDSNKVAPRRSSNINIIMYVRNLNQNNLAAQCRTTDTKDQRLASPNPIPKKQTRPCHASQRPRVHVLSCSVPAQRVIICVQAGRQPAKQ
jgi:hypothetical protein